MTGGLTGGRLDFVLYRRYSRCWRTGTNKSPVVLRDQVETPVSFFDPIVFFDPKESRCGTRIRRMRGLQLQVGMRARRATVRWKDQIAADISCYHAGVQQHHGAS